MTRTDSNLNRGNILRLACAANFTLNEFVSVDVLNPGVEANFHSFLTSRFNPGETGHATQRIRFWAVPKMCVDALKKK